MLAEYAVAAPEHATIYNICMTWHEAIQIDHLEPNREDAYPHFCVYKFTWKLRW